MAALITLIILIFSAIVHEVMHGVVAEYFGDDTARDAGRITLNPIPHIDPFGSILLPFLLLLAGSPIVLGAAKPVPVNFDRLKPKKWGMIAVSLAGPLSNVGLAMLAVIPLKFGLASSIAQPILLQFILLNIVLAVFNLLPIPPLDGSKIIAALGSDEWMDTILSYERYGFILVLVFLMLGWLDRILIPVVLWFSKIFGISFF